MLATTTHMRRGAAGGVVLVAGLARLWTDLGSTATLGVGIDEGTGLVVDPEGGGIAYGRGSVYFARLTVAPSSCRAGAPLEVEGVEVRRLSAGDAVTLPAGETEAPATTLSAVEGRLDPPDPY